MNKVWNNYWFQFIEKYPDKPWNWNWISQNPNITMEMIEKYPEKPWDWSYGISRNTFKKNKEQFEMRTLNQKFIQENLLEEFVKVYMRPKRIIMLLDMGYSTEELDDIM